MERHKEKTKSQFARNLMILNFINIFIKNLKARTGIYGPLGKKQLRIINDVSMEKTDFDLDDQEAENQNLINENNLFVKLIVSLLKLFILIYL